MEVAVEKRGYYYPFALDYEQLVKDYPPHVDYFNSIWKWPRDRVRELQEKRFMQQVARAWQIPFYQRLWGKAGIEHGDIKGLDELPKLPSFTVYDLRDSIRDYPPFGDYQGVTPADAARMPLIIQSSGGTTGTPRPMFYSAKDREVSSIITSRFHHMQGIKPGDMVQIMFAFSTVNAGFWMRESLWKYTGAIPLTTGTGSATPTKQQIDLAKTWGSRAMCGFPDYIRYLASVAKEMGIDPRKDLNIRVIHTYLGNQDRSDIEEAFGANVYDNYGTHEMVGTPAGECGCKNGRHIMDDAYIVEIMDPSTKKVLEPGQKGNIVVTDLFKYVTPLIRYDTNDVSQILTHECSCGGKTPLLDKLYGRADNMIKLRGVNVFPDAIGSIVAEDKRTTKEYFCVVERKGEGLNVRDEMTVLVESIDDSVDREVLKNDLEVALKASLEVKMNVQVFGKDELEPYTQRSTTTKTKRLLDKRSENQR
ncbi:phenylacetate--CoA ligase [Paradesulfitobacterium aromaticivorans]